MRISRITAPVGEVITPTFGLELLFELFISHSQRAYAVGIHILDIYLIGARLGVKAHLSPGDNLHSVLRGEFEFSYIKGKHNGAHNRSAVLDTEIIMTAAVVVLEVADFARDENAVKHRVAVKQAFDIAVELRDGVYFRRYGFRCYHIYTPSGQDKPHPQRCPRTARERQRMPYIYR